MEDMLNYMERKANSEALVTRKHKLKFRIHSLRQRVGLGLGHNFKLVFS